MPQVPRLPRKVTIDVAKSHACHAECTSTSPSATPATQSEGRCRNVVTSCVCVSKLCGDKLCEDKLCVDKLCVSKFGDKLCVSKLCGEEVVWDQVVW